jgi:hypothetical protein
MASKISARLGHLAKDAHNRTAAGCRAAAKFVQAELRKAVDKPYPPASRPGAAPHRRTGKYQASLYCRVIGRSGGIVAGSSMPDRALWLEEGTRRMAARPHFFKTIRRVQARALAMIRGKA